MAFLSKLLIEDAQSALRDLYGLVPVADREAATADLRTLEIALSTLGNFVDGFRKVESVIATVEVDLTNAHRQSVRIQDGLDA